jgi:hypothetical protein
MSPKTRVNSHYLRIVEEGIHRVIPRFLMIQVLGSLEAPVAHAADIQIIHQEREVTEEEAEVLGGTRTGKETQHRSSK